MLGQNNEFVTYNGNISKSQMNIIPIKLFTHCIFSLIKHVLILFLALLLEPNENLKQKKNLILNYSTITYKGVSGHI